MTREQFIANYENWDSYKPLLWEGLERTQDGIIEMGMGKGSTQLLHDYALKFGRRLFSYDSNPAWVNQFKHLQCDRHYMSPVQVTDGNITYSNWDLMHEMHDIWVEPILSPTGGNQIVKIGLVFIDHAPGERRKVDIAIFANKAQIIVAHDTEPNADHGYQMRDEIKKFKYWRDFETPGAWASIMSNTIDVTKPL